MLLRNFILPLVLLLLCFEITIGQTFTNNIGGAVPSNNVEICFPVTVSGVGVINSTSFGLEKVTININHLNVGDLEVVLKSPGGTRIPLVTRRGLGGDNFINTCFTSNASTSITAGVAPFTGNFFPETGLGLVNNGQNADGVWNLCIKDVFNSAIAGTLLNYSITFSNNPAPPINPPTVQDCPGAIAICRPIYTETVSYVGIGNVSNEIRAPLTCLGTERNSVWYTFTAQTAGIVSFLITPNVSSEDYDWAVFNLSNAKCSEIFTNAALTVRCNFSGQSGPTGPSGQAGGQYSPTLPVLAGQTFAIIVSHFTNTSNGYTIDFSASTALVFDTSKASITSAIPQNKCGTNQINIGLSENVTCSSIKLSDISVTGPGGPYTIAGFNSPNCLVNSSYTKSLSINVSPAMTTPGSYQVCINPSAGSLTDLCGNTGVSNCVSFTIDTTIIPVFNPIPTFCQGNISPVLPSTSANLVSGSWTPNTISNVSSGIYTFNANATFCPFPLPLSVTVYPKPVLGNDKTIPICSLQTLNLSNQYDTTSRIVRWTLGGSSIPDSTAVSAGGVYQIVVIDSNTCRDTALLNVVIKPNTYDTTNAVTCQYQLPYLWNGNSYSTAGQFIDTIPNAPGCDSIRTLNLKIGTKSYSTTAIKICQSQLPFTWNSKVYTAAGIYKDSIPNIIGCDSVLTLNLSVGSEIRDTSNVSICQLQLPYLWYGNNYSGAGTYYDTITNASGCDSFLVLILKIQSDIKDSSTLVLCQDLLPFTWQGVNIVASGVYKDTLKTVFGCDSILILNLIVLSNSSSNNIISICQKQLPFLWNGNMLYSSGSYKDTILNVAGCDSIMNLTLTIKPNSASTTNVSICSKQLPYLWIGNSYTSGGIYKDTIPNIAGCDSVITLNLIAKASTSSTTNAIVCSNKLPYFWNGKNYSISGIYKDSIPNAAGCDSIMTLNLSVKQISFSNTNISICSKQLPYSWNGNIYTSAGSYNDTLPNASGCDSMLTLNLIVKQNTLSNTIVTICNKQLPFFWNGNNYNVAGTYKDTLPNAAGCDSILTLNLSIKGNSTSTTNVSICSKQLPYLWNGNSYNSGGIYKDTIPNVAGCDSMITLNLIVKANTASTSNAIICSNKLPYAWNGKNYSTSGSYKDTIPNAARCDSIMTLNLSVKQISFSTTNISICSKQLPYSWNGNIYTSAGSYKDTLPNASGCDSMLTLNLILKQNSFSNTIVTICSKQLPFFWNGNNYNVAGTYKDTLPNAAGCDSILTLNLIVKPITSSTTNISICSKQLPYLWNGNTYTSGGTYKDTIPNVTGCDSILTLLLIIKSNSSSTTSISICPGQLPYLWNGKTYIAGGIFKDTIANVAGCDSIISLNLAIKSNTFSTENQTICPRQLPFIWNGNSYNAGGIFKITKLNSQDCDSIITLNLVVKQNTSSTTNITICPKQLPIFWNGKSYNTQGTFNDTMNNATGCDSILILNLNLKINTFSISSANICPSQLPYTWNGKMYSVSGIYRDTITNTAGCDSIMTLQLNVRPNSTSTSTINICPEQLPYLWNGKLFAAAGNYVAVLTNAFACDSLATLILGLKPTPPAPILSSNSPICSGDILNLSAIANGADSYKWIGSSGFLSNQANPVINNVTLANKGSYSATITSDGCISPTTSIIVDVIQRPIILTSADKQIFEGDTAILNPSIISSLSNLSFKWSPSIYFLSPDSIKNPQILGVTTTTYYLTVSAGNQCPSNAGEFVVKVLPKQKPFNIPNAFSPNDDGINDTWIINELNAYPDAQVQVYNRNGAMVFNSIGYRRPWDGKYNGNVLPASTYYFVIVTKQGRNPISGWVSILK